jgi:hypothetical protein
MVAASTLMERLAHSTEAIAISNCNSFSGARTSESTRTNRFPLTELHAASRQHLNRQAIVAFNLRLVAVALNIGDKREILVSAERLVKSVADDHH